MRRSLVLIAAGLVVLGACGDEAVDGPGATSPSATSPSESTASGSATLANDAAPDALRFIAPQVGGGSLDMSAYTGTTVAFWFWAPT